MAVKSSDSEMARPKKSKKEKMKLVANENEEESSERKAKKHKKRSKESEETDEPPVKKFNISIKMQSDLMEKPVIENQNKKGPKIIIAKSKKQKEEENKSKPTKKLNKVYLSFHSLCSYFFV